MTTTIFTMMMCFINPDPTKYPDYCKRLDFSDNQYETLQDCKAALYPREDTKNIKFFCASKEVSVWKRAN